MKFRFAPFFFILVFSLVSCSKNEDLDSSCGPFGTAVDGKILKVSPCKNDSGGFFPKAPSGVELATYQYFPEDKLVLLNHVNAGFNCCPGKISASFATSNDTIIVRENEAQAACRCECLYDIAYELGNAERKKYVLVIYGPLTDGKNLKPLVGILDLEKIEGEISVKRNRYPW